MVGHADSRLTLHSLHSGSIQKTIRLNAPPSHEKAIRDMWWLKHDLKERPEAFKDVFDRKETVRGLRDVGYVDCTDKISRLE